MAHRELPKYVHWRGRPGAVKFLYFECKDHRQKIDAEFGTPQFWAEYSQLLNGPAHKAPKTHTWSRLIDKYFDGPRFTQRAPRTQSDYRKYMEKLRMMLGEDDPAGMRRKHVIKMRDANADRPRLANYLVQCLSILFEYAIDLGWMPDDRNPAKGVTLISLGEGTREPWPNQLVVDFRDQNAIGTRARLIFEMCLGTAQRMGDILRMQWGDVSQDGIRVRQNKTRKRLVIPLTTQLEACLRATPRDGLFIIAGDHGKPLSYRQAAYAMKIARDACGAGEAHDNHALRYTATVEIAVLGMTDSQIASITGMSEKTIAHYTRHLRQIEMAKEVQSLRK